MVRGHGLDRIQVYARIVHQLTSERTKPIDASAHDRNVGESGTSAFEINEAKAAIHSNADLTLHYGDARAAQRCHDALCRAACLDVQQAWPPHFDALVNLELCRIDPRFE